MVELESAEMMLVNFNFSVGISNILLDRTYSCFDFNETYLFYIGGIVSHCGDVTLCVHFFSIFVTDAIFDCGQFGKYHPCSGPPINHLL